MGEDNNTVNMNDTANTDHAETQAAYLGKYTKNPVATAQLLGAGYKQKVALPESISCVMVAGRVAVRTLSIKEVGGNGFTFVAREVASLGVKVAELRCMVTQLRNYPKNSSRRNLIQTPDEVIRELSGMDENQLSAFSLSR